MSKIIKQVQIASLPVVINGLRLLVADDRKPITEERPLHLSTKDYIIQAEQKAAAHLAKAKQEMEEELLLRYQESKEAGYAAGYAEGNSQGHLEGQSDGFTQGKNQGHEEGYADGFTQGEKAAFEKMNANLFASAETAAKILSAANLNSQQAILSTERQIVDLAVAVAKKILAYEIDTNSEVVVSIVKTTLDKVRNQKQLSIRINPMDFQAAIAAKGDFEVILQREQAIEFVADQTVSRGGCVIDSAFGSADARVETQLQSLLTAMRSRLHESF